MSEPVRVAVVGVGDFGVLHAKTLSHLGDARLVALVDPNQERARSLAPELGNPVVFPALVDLIAAEAADAVIIATRADTHLPLSEQAAKAGLHVLVEKPLANSAREIREFQDRIGQMKTAVMVDHLCLFHSLVAPAVERLRTTGFRALRFVRHRPDRIGRRFPEDHPIQLTMVHDLYVAAAIVNGEEPVEFSANESTNQEGRVDMSWATLRWADGRMATFQSHLMLPDGSPAEGWDSLEVFGSNFHSRIITNPAQWTWTDSLTTWPVSLEITEGGGMLAALLKNFLNACRGAEVARGCRVVDALQVQTWIEKLISIAKKS